MTIGTGGEGGSTPPTSGFDFMLNTDPGRDTSQPERAGAAIDFGDSPRRERRRASPVDSRSILVPIVIVVASLALLGGAGYTAWSLVQGAEAEVKADSAAFCTDLASTPGVLSTAGFGWPTDSTDIATTLEAMKLYQARWENLAKIGPPSIHEDLGAIATAATTLVNSVEATSTIDRAGNLSKIERVTSATVLPAWADKYCD